MPVSNETTKKITQLSNLILGGAVGALIAAPFFSGGQGEVTVEEAQAIWNAIGEIETAHEIHTATHATILRNLHEGDYDEEVLTRVLELLVELDRQEGEWVGYLRETFARSWMPAPPKPVEPVPPEDYPLGADFGPDGRYNFLPDEPVLELLEAGASLQNDPENPDVMVWNAGWNSDQIVVAPDELSGQAVVYTSTFNEYHNETLPKWGIRSYNVVGSIEDLTLARVGDFTSGREGHGIYVNLGGSFGVKDYTALQCGGQAIQVVFRESETRLPQSQWPDSSDTLLLENVSAIDCGMINDGMAVRASYPFAIYNPGTKVVITNLKVHTTNGEAFPTSTGEGRSHGALFVGYGQTQRRTPYLNVTGVDLLCIDPDRPMIKLEGIDVARIREGSIVVPGSLGRVEVADDCGSVTLGPFDTDIQVNGNLLPAGQVWVK